MWDTLSWVRREARICWRISLTFVSLAAVMKSVVIRAAAVDSRSEMIAPMRPAWSDGSKSIIFIIWSCGSTKKRSASYATDISERMVRAFSRRTLAIS
jgi:hypothetical protein